MTIKQFWIDPYQQLQSTTISSVDGPRVTVASTIFFAFSGGQESDRGTIATYPVLLAAKSDAGIEYTLPDDHRLGVGDSVDIVIDWERRYRLMRLHFAAELVLELVYRRFAGIEKFGAHIAEDKARLDFLWLVSLSAELPSLLEEGNRLIAADHPITSAFDDEGAERRSWSIAGFARVACGGTHLRRTGEIGAIRLKRNNIGRGKERIEITLAG
jgi:Ser-tRNA(Ala) deacylase AlaX